MRASIYLECVPLDDPKCLVIRSKLRIKASKMQVKESIEGPWDGDHVPSCIHAKMQQRRAFDNNCFFGCINVVCNSKEPWIAIMPLGASLFTKAIVGARSFLIFLLHIAWIDMLTIMYHQSSLCKSQPLELSNSQEVVQSSHDSSYTSLVKVQ